MRTQEIYLELRKIHERLDDLERKLVREEIVPSFPATVIDESLLLRLPDHLRMTYIALAKHEGKECDATTISMETGKAREVESHYLNMLALMGYVVRRRERKRIYFKVNPHEQEKNKKTE